MKKIYNYLHRYGGAPGSGGISFELELASLVFQGIRTSIAKKSSIL